MKWIACSSLFLCFVILLVRRSALLLIRITLFPFFSFFLFFFNCKLNQWFFCPDMEETSTVFIYKNLFLSESSLLLLRQGNRTFQSLLPDQTFRNSLKYVAPIDSLRFLHTSCKCNAPKHQTWPPQCWAEHSHCFLFCSAEMSQNENCPSPTPNSLTVLVLYWFCSGSYTSHNSLSVAHSKVLCGFGFFGVFFCFLVVPHCASLVFCTKHEGTCI